MRMPWPAERDAELHRLFAEGLSYSAIGRSMAMTKNAVLGRARRLNFPLRRPDIAQTVRREVTTFPPYGHCQWIVNDRSPFIFCGHASEGTWCPTHRQRVYIPIKPRPLDDTPLRGYRVRT